MKQYKPFYWTNNLEELHEAVLSGALGFIAAEAATMWGGAFLWTRHHLGDPNIVWLMENKFPMSG